jgi:zinc transport system permease protein
MAVLAALIGAGAATGGLWVSYHFDTPTGPSIVVLAMVAFVVLLAATALARWRGIAA